MKKLFYFVFGLSLVYFILLNFLDYSNLISDKIEKGKTKIIINQPNNLTNDDFINEIKKYVKECDTDIMYMVIDNSKEKIVKKYYLTAYTKNFTEIGDLQNLLKSNDYLTNDANNSLFGHISGSNLLYNVYIYNFDDIINYNLQSSIYLLKNDKANEFIQLLKESGYSVEVVKEQELSKKYLSLRSLFLPLILLSSSFIIYMISKRKEVIIKKLMGFKKYQIICDNVKECIKGILLISLFISFISVVLLNIFYIKHIFDYIIFMAPKIITALLILIIGMYVCSLLNIFCNNTEYIKGKNSNYDFFMVILMVKIIFVLFILFKSSNAFLEVQNIYNINKININISNIIKDYYSFPVNASASAINQSNQWDYNDRLDLFYDETVEKYEGILINTRNYRNVSLHAGEDLASLYNQNSITVNGNYLEINKIRDVNGKIIDATNFKGNKMNLLLPEGTDKNEIIKKYTYSYEISSDVLNILYYKKGENIRSFNPYSGRWQEGLIIDPVIEIYNKDFMQGQMLNYVSGQYYFLKLDSYEQIKPLLMKYNLDSVILQAIKVSNVYDNSISNIRKQLINDIITLIIYIISLLFLIIYYSKVYFNLYEQNIIYKFLHGFKILEIHVVPVCLIAIQYIVFGILSVFTRINALFILVFMLVEIIAFTLCIINLQTKNIINIIKGENKCV